MFSHEAEEPPEKTIFLLITEHEDQIINTIRSRCQALHFPVLSEKDIAKSLVVKENSTESEALKNIALMWYEGRTTELEPWYRKMRSRLTTGVVLAHVTFVVLHVNGA